MLKNLLAYLMPMAGSQSQAIWPFVLIGVAVVLVVAVIIINKKRK